MGKKKGGKSSGAVSKGERPNVSKWVRKDMRNSVAPIVTLQNKWKAFSEGKRVMVTIPNPSAKVETNKPFITKDVNTMKNVAAVKRSVRNLVLTNHYEKPFHPEIGSGVRGILFEPMTPVTAVILTEHIENVIENYEPRARLIGVRALPDLDRNAYEVSVEFFVVNAPTELIEMSMMLEVAR
jgi:phage baseplate assembly protein W